MLFPQVVRDLPPPFLPSSFPSFIPFIPCFLLPPFSDSPELSSKRQGSSELIQKKNPQEIFTYTRWICTSCDKHKCLVWLCKEKRNTVRSKD